MVRAIIIVRQVKYLVVAQKNKTKQKKNKKKTKKKKKNVNIRF